MTVRELIEALSDFDPDALVVTPNEAGAASEIACARVGTYHPHDWCVFVPEGRDPAGDPAVPAVELA